MSHRGFANSSDQVVRQISRVGWIVLLPVLISRIVYGSQVANSLLLGIILWALPTFHFARKVFRHLGKLPPQGILRVFYRAELFKLLLSGFFFIMIVKLLSVNVPLLFTGYLAAQLLFLILLVVKSREGL